MVSVASCPPSPVLCLQEWTGYYCIFHNLACHCVALHYSSGVLNPLVLSLAWLPIPVSCNLLACWGKTYRTLLLSFKMPFSADTQRGGRAREACSIQYVESCHKLLWFKSMCSNGTARKQHQHVKNMSTCGVTFACEPVSALNRVCVCQSRQMVVWRVSVLWL